MRIAIIGGGIGGLAAALRLLKAGFDVHVYDQAAAIGEIGAGIQISPNASRLLVRLGLKPAMDKVGVRPLAVHQRRWDDGRTLQRAPLGPEMGPEGHVVHYWVASGRLMNVVCVVEHGTWTKESWTDKGEVAEVLERYEGWHPIVRGLIGAFPETFIWALHDRLPLPRWSDGRVALLGDACHPMLPMMAQGAAQSIEDGAALAASLTTRPGDVTGALVRYEEVRKPRASRLQEASAANRKRFHLPDGPEQQKRDEALATSGDRSIANIGWLYRHDAAQVA
jgi:2-polyprenyl-6-methoxyphenol hydroxylase-like FAD-dependent oxidoreductase